jgi:formamidase
MKAFRLAIDHDQSILKAPRASHNRWHPAIEAALRISSGDRVEIETRDSFDGQIVPNQTTAQDFGGISIARAHPLTGPIYVEDAEPGDLLAIKIEEVLPAPYGFTAILPGFGFLRDCFPMPYLLHWDLAGGFAVSPQLPDVKIPGAPFMGVMGLAPSHALLNQILERERDLHRRGGMVFLPDPHEAVPDAEMVANNGLRTIAPHETGGNLDIKQLTAGTTLYLPVSTEGGLFSTGDAHFAQGDGESCGTAIETSATLVARFNVLKGEAARREQKDPSFARHEEVSARAVSPDLGRFYATTGNSVRRDGRNECEDLNTAARNALLNMIDFLTDAYSFTREQAYCLASVAVDLRVSQVVDVPNVIVSAFLPLEVIDRR